MSIDNLHKFLKDNPDKIDAVLEEEAQKDALRPYGGREYKAKSKQARIEQYKKNKALRAGMLENKIPFISESFDPDFSLYQGMTLVVAKSGESKSTTCANILAGFIQSCPGRSAIVIGNEEATDAVLDRVSCIINKKNYIDLHKNKMRPRDREMIEQTSMSITQFIEIVEDSSWDMSCLEDVKSVLEHAATNGTSLVIVDYLQTITHSRDEPGLESFQVSKKLGLYLKDYGRRVGVPVVVFAQLKPKTESGAIQDRIQNDKTIYNHAFNVIEVIPNFETLLTEFVLHKGRFELKQGKKILMKFNCGRYETDDIDI